MRLITLSTVLLLACASPALETADPEPDGADTGDTAVSDWEPGPCAGGNWGSIRLDGFEAAIQVRMDGSDDADGSLSTPVATIEAAMALARSQEGVDRIVVGPGSYTGALSIGEVLGDEDGLTIEGCGTDEVTIQAVNEWDSIIRVNGTQDVRLAGFTLTGGRRALMIYGGATAYLDSIAIMGSMRCGLLVDGALTAVAAGGLGVYDTLPDTYDADGYGYGVLVQGAQMTLNDAVIDGNATVGMLIHDATAIVALDDVEVTNTSAPGGFLGRGIQVQDLAQVTAFGLRLSGNSDAGLYARQALAVDLASLTVGEIGLSNALDGGDAAGDGVVVTQGDTDHNFDVATFHVALADFTVSGAARAGVLLDRVTGVISGTNAITASADDPGAGAVLIQGGAVVTGGAVYDLDAAGLPMDTFGLGLDTDYLDDVGVDPE